SCETRFSVAIFFFFFQAEDGIRDFHVTGVQTCALPIYALANDSNVPAALKAFEAARIGIGRRFVARGRALGAYIQPERRTAQEREDAKRHAGPERVMREIALLDFLYE